MTRLSALLVLLVACTSGGEPLDRFHALSQDVLELDCACTLAPEDAPGNCRGFEHDQRELDCFYDAMSPFTDAEPELFACWRRAAAGLRDCVEDAECVFEDRDDCSAEWNYRHCGEPCSTLVDAERTACEVRLAEARRAYDECRWGL
ncbi:MAG: hypothetical protein H6721_15240 [Sandaracinus sp.]|nr:hypothetical protein [Sandaracinus sp.]MCB9612337.1 hypothetical protein [Sandaracinus sp.]MCB9617595.1 hypothetical protein [Sandaracinus sp.]MCB9633469.1 hypothetical protein [Sandaracinus sp.]